MNSPFRHSTPTESVAAMRKLGAIAEPDRRHSMIAEAAYYASERRGFAPGHEYDDWLAAEKQLDAVASVAKTAVVEPSSVRASTDADEQQQTGAEKHKLPQKPWYPTIERRPLFYNVETGPTLNEGSPVLLVTETEEEQAAAAARVLRETVNAPVQVCADDIWARGGAALSSLWG